MPELGDSLSPHERSKLIALRQRLKAEGRWQTEITGKHLVSDILEAVEGCPVDENGLLLRKTCIHCASPSRDEECGKCYGFRRGIGA